MRAVFVQALYAVDAAGLLPAKRSVEIVRLFFQEMWDLPAVLWSAWRFRGKAGRGDARSKGSEQGAPSALDARIGHAASWGEALLGASPFLLFGLVYALEAVTELGYFRDVPNGRLDLIGLPLPGVVYLILCVGLAIGWRKGFPRWSFSYLGMVLYFGSYYSSGRFYGVVYGWRAWIPVIAVALIATLLTRSLRPLARLIQDAREDWTRLSFVLYAFVLPVFTVIFMDGAWGQRELVGLGIDTLLLLTGATLFLRSRSTLARVLALQAAKVSLFGRNVLMAGWYPSPRAGGPPLTLLSVTFLLLFWGGLMFLPVLVGLLHRRGSALDM
jgi:hypothetical protein